MTIASTYLRPVETIAPEASAADAANRMKETGVGALVVVSEEGPVGVVTDRDLALGVLVQDRDPAQVRVAELAHSPLHSVTPEASLLDVVGIMRSHLVRRVPIIDAGGALVGIVTADDLIADFGDQIGWAAQATRAGFDYEACPPEARRSPLGRE